MDASSLARSGGQRLLAAGFVSGPAEARTLLAHAMGVSPSRLSRALLMGDPVDGEAADRFEELLAGRLGGTLVQHLTGRAPFRHLDLAVGPGVFIPRPETELLAQAVLDFLDAQAGPVAASPSTAPVRTAVLDLCTGSGALALAIATERPGTAVTAVELSAVARDYAELNIAESAEALQSARSTVDLVAGDALAFTGGPFAAVVSNPPYVPAGEETDEVAASDPALALYGGGVHGMEFPGRLISRAPALLAPGGLFAMEHAESQAASVADAFRAAGLADVAGHADYTGRSRFTTGLSPAGDSQTGGE